jgi:hypothetical protein
MRIASKFAVIATILVLALHAWAQNPANPIQVALLRWYPANLVTQFNPCGKPQGLAFDGSHIWVGCGGSGTNANTLVEYNASDGALVQTVSNVGGSYGVLYDGANIWSSSTVGSVGQVVKVDAATGGKNAFTKVTVGSSPEGMAFDGAYIWVANFGSNSVTQILASTATVVNTFALGSTCPTPEGMAFDGTYVWVVCHENNNVVALTSSGTIEYNVTVGAFPTLIAYDGETTQTNGPFLWVTNSSSGTVSKIALGTCSPTTKACAAPLSYGVGTTPNGVVFDGTYIWVANGGDNTVTRLLQSNPTVMATYPPSGQGLALSDPYFMAFDGANIWISNNTGTGILSKF